ncbi:MAG: TonB-dependent receptor [Terricaulis sp.]
MSKFSSLLRRSVSTAAAVIAIGGGTALAQTAPQSTQSSGASASTSTDDTATEEIIVTAEKRTERLIDAPVAVSSVNADQLQRQNITQLTDLSRAVANFGENGSIRGVTTSGAARSSEGAIAVVLDGVNLGHPAVDSPQISSLFDLERVEVLAGPQGTLFGTNASGGVINVISRAPNPDYFEAIAHVDAGSFNYQREQLTLNIPLMANMAVRVGLHHDTDEGIVENVITGDKRESFDWGGRARLLWEPNNNLTINLIGEYDRGGNNGQNDIANGNAPTPALQARLAACGITPSLSNEENCPLGVADIPQRDIKALVSLQADYDLNGYTLTSISAYSRHTRGSFSYIGFGGDSDFLSENILDTNLTPEADRILSQELRITSPADQPVEFVAGLFYSTTSQHDQVIQGGGLGLPLSLLLPFPPFSIGRVNVIDIDQRSFAAFGQTTIHVTDALSLIAGARYSDDRLEDVSTSATGADLLTYGFSPLSPALGFILAPVDERATTHNFSWKLGAQYQLSHDVMTYFTATRGYKGPAVNDQASPPITQAIIAPEIPMNYELGLKGSFLDNRLVATAALFYDKIEHFQTSVFTPATPSNPIPGFSQGNAPYIITKGVELNLLGRPTDDLSFNFGVLYNPANYASSFLVACNPTQTAGVGACSAAGTTSPVSQLAGAPKWRVVLNGEYTHDLSTGAIGFIQGDLTYQSAVFTGATPDPVSHLPESWLLGGRIGVRSQDGHFGISLFGRNLLDQDDPRISRDVLSGFDGGGPNALWVSPVRGRTFGVSLDVRM